MHDKSKTSSKSSTSMAVNISSDKLSVSGFHPCSLCSKEDRFADHPLYKCTRFETPIDKGDELKRLKGCTKCGHLSHEESSCRLDLIQSVGITDSITFHFFVRISKALLLSIKMVRNK